MAIRTMTHKLSERAEVGLAGYVAEKYWNGVMQIWTLYRDHGARTVAVLPCPGWPRAAQMYLLRRRAEIDAGQDDCGCTAECWCDRHRAELAAVVGNHRAAKVNHHREHRSERGAEKRGR